MRRILLVLVLLLAVAWMVPVAAAAEPTEVGVGVYVVNFGNYDTNRGTYVMDFYVWFRWDATTAPEGFTPEKFEFMNGRAAAKERISDETDEAGTREIWYRIQANLYTEPQFQRYPYDTQALQIVFEDALNQRDTLVYVPAREESGVDEDVRLAGWRIQDVSVSTGEKSYPFGEDYDRLVFTVTVFREPVSTTLKTFLPVAAFVLVSGLSFFFHPSKVAQRLTLGTSMLISAVMFHVSQTISLPPMAQLILFDKIMLAVYSFLAASLLVTTLIAIDEDFWKDRDYTKPINRYGAFAATLLPVAIFGLLNIV